MNNEVTKEKQPHHDAIAAASALRPAILKARDETEARRELPENIVDELVQAGLFRIALPVEMGGPGMSPVEMLEVYEELARAEASVAWIVWNNSLPCFFARFLEDDAREQIFGDATLAYASSTRPSGKAVKENGGYRVSGRWSLVSGCVHAEWIELMCVVEEDGEVRMNESGMPEMLLACVPKGSFEIIDTWHVGGLRGTGSHDVAVEDTFVDRSMTFFPMTPSQIDEPIGKIPVICTMAAGHAALCLGICQSSIDAVIELGESKVTVDPVPDLRDKAVNQFAIACAVAKVSSMRDHIKKTTSTIWDKAVSGEPAAPEDIAIQWSAANVASRECRNIVEELYEVAGTSALYTDNVLERCHRDIHAVMQHIIVQRHWVENAGRTMFGLEPSHPLYSV